MEISTAHSIHRLTTEMNRAAENTLQTGLGLSYGRFYFLFVMNDLGQATQHAIASALGYSDPAVSNMVSELVKEDIVTVQVDPSHRRRRLVTLTSKGKQLIEQSMQLLDDCFTDIARAAHVDEAVYAALTEQLITALHQKNYGA